MSERKDKWVIVGSVLFSSIQLSCSFASVFLGIIGFLINEKFLGTLFVNLAVLISQLSIVISLVLFIIGNFAFRKKVEKIFRDMCCFWRRQTANTVGTSVPSSHWSTRPPIKARPNAAGNDIPMERVLNLGARASICYDDQIHFPAAEIDQTETAGIEKCTDDKVSNGRTIALTKKPKSVAEKNEERQCLPADEEATNTKESNRIRCQLCPPAAPQRKGEGQ